MTYHHLNRFIAHCKHPLEPNERLIAWHLAYQIRAKEGYYSESLSRLEDTLDLHKRTLQRAINALVIELGLFDRQEPQGIQAAKYRLLVSCPPNCENLEDHNTRQELTAIFSLGGHNTPTLRGNQTTHIKKREEEDTRTLEVLEKKVLGLIKKTLKNLTGKTADHFTLEGFSTLRPKEVLQAVFDLFETKNLDTWARQEPYLKTTIERSPKNLLRYAEDLELIEAGLDTPEDQKPAVEVSYEIGSTPDRVFDYWLITAAKYLEAEAAITEEAVILPYEVLDGLSTKFNLAAHFLDFHANAGTLNEGVIQGTYEVLEILQVAHQFAGLEDRYELRADAKGDLQVRFMQDIKDLGNLEGLLKPEELEKLAARNDAINEAKLRYRIANQVEGEYTPAKFFQTEEYKTTSSLYPEPLDAEGKKNRLEEFFKVIGNQANEHFEKVIADKTGESYLDYLKKTYTWQKDLEEFLAEYPQRPEGNQDFKKTAKAFLNLRKVLTLHQILERANLYKRTLGDTFPKSAANWLEDQAFQMKAGLI